MMRVAPIYQCLFFVDGRIEYWENIESYSDEVIEVLLDRKLRGKLGGCGSMVPGPIDLPDRSPCRSPVSAIDDG